MVEFGTGYLMPMDREYGGSASHDNATSDVGVGLGDFGMSLGLGPVPNVQAVKSKLHAGTRKLEFVFTGMNKGSGQGQTPEMYGKKQRIALEEIGKVNKVDFTTHATVGVYGLAGMDNQGNFSKTYKNVSIQEIKRAIEFAADVGRGGPVVVHTGEFARSLVDADWNQHDDDWKGRFRQFEDEEGRTTWRVVDIRTGNTLDQARKNRKVSRPEWNVAEAGQEYTDLDGTKKVAQEGEERIYVDYFGRRLEPDSRVPKYDKEKQNFVIRQMGWEEMVKEAKEMTQRARESWRAWKEGKITTKKFEESLWTRFSDAKSEDEVLIRPEEAWVIQTFETNAANSRGWALYYGGNFDEQIENVKKLEKARGFYEKLETATSEDEKWKLKTKMKESGLAGMVPEEAQFPTEILDRQIKELKRHIRYAQDASAAQWAQAEEARELIRNVESADTYAFREACDAYAQSAVSAMLHSQKLDKEGKLKRPLAIAMENLFPEHYGSHPDELIKLVHGSRQRMQELLQQGRGMSPEEARKKAQEHITATFDTGHLNMWRKYWHADPSKSMEENDREFNGWMLQKLGQMIDADVLGHVHLDDNYGYHDDHLAPGEGNAPIREMVGLLKKKGYKGSMIVEPGADYTTDVSGFHSVMKTWRLFGSPVYGAAGGIGPRQRTWEQVGYGYFGQNQPPYFVFNPYTPSEDWTMWSGVPLE